jgi:hypothetical protein
LLKWGEGLPILGGNPFRGGDRLADLGRRKTFQKSLDGLTLFS